jgi:hypothetical protein
MEEHDGQVQTNPSDRVSWGINPTDHFAENKIQLAIVIVTLQVDK